MDTTHLIAVVAVFWGLVSAFLAGFQIGDTWRDSTWRECVVIAFWPVVAALGAVALLVRLPFLEVRRFRIALKDRETMREFRKWQAARKETPDAGN